MAAGSSTRDRSIRDGSARDCSTRSSPPWRPLRLVCILLSTCLLAAPGNASDVGVHIGLGYHSGHSSHGLSGYGYPGYGYPSYGYSYPYPYHDRAGHRLTYRHSPYRHHPYDPYRYRRSAFSYADPCRRGVELGAMTSPAPLENAAALQDPSQSYTEAFTQAAAAGWSMIALGAPDQAQQLFGNLARCHPGEGLFKIGYAIAAAARGDLSAGTWAMRGALSDDPAALQALHLDAALQDILVGLLGSYSAYPRIDGAFMLASLNYLLEDQAAARAMIEEARQAGDYHLSARNLARLISRQADPPARR